METLYFILKSAGILTLFYFIYALFLKKETFFSTNRHFLLIGILASVSFPLLQFTKTILLEAPILESLPSSALAMEAMPSNVVLIQDSQNFYSLENILIAIYTVGVLIIFLRFIFQLFTLLLLLKKYPSEKLNGYNYIKVSESISPFSFFNYVVFNPLIHHKNDLGMILAHEQVHVRQYHSIDVLLTNFLVAIQWFNPFAWQYKKSIEENLEFIADKNTIKQVESKKEYQLALVKASAANLLPALTNNFYKSFIKKRIIMLNKTNSKRQSALKVTLVLPLLALFLWSFNVSEVTKYVESTSKEIKSKNPVIEKEVIKSISEENTVTETSESTTLATAITETPEQINNMASENNNEIMEYKSTKIQEKFRVKINKNTKDTELDEIKQAVKTKYGIELSYAANRNDNNEITSLALSYTGNGNNGNYQLSQDQGIDEFFFFIDEDGKTGFWSEAAEERRKEREEKRKERMQERKHDMRDRNKDMSERMEERKKDMEARREKMKKRQSNMSNNYKTAHSLSDGNRVIINNGGSGSVIINKNTTDAELSKMKQNLAEKNIEFNYKNLKRNSAGEITGIKITTNDGKGSKTATAIKGSDDEPIDQIVIN